MTQGPPSDGAPPHGDNDAPDAPAPPRPKRAKPAALTGTPKLRAVRKGEASEAPSPRWHLHPCGQWCRFALGTEVEIARELAAELEGEGPQLVYDEGHVHQYGSDRWQKREKTELAERIQEWDGALYSRKKEPGIVRLGQRSIYGAIGCLNDYRAKDKFFEQAPQGVAFTNGFVSLDAGGGVAIVPHAPEHRQRAVLPFAFVPDAWPEQFITFLHATWAGEHDIEQRVQFLGEFMGACMMGVATGREIAVILTGEGSNGKSTFLKILDAVFDGTVRGAVSPQKWGHEYYCATLAGIMINIVAEMPDVEIMDGEIVKAVISGERIQARPIREAPFWFRPRAGHLFAANTLPAVRDMSKGFWRRWRILSFPNELTDDQKIIGLGPMIAEAEAHLIASWAIGCVAQLSATDMYSPVASSEIAMAAWRHEADSVSLWLAECTEPSPSLHSPARTLFTHYATWCTANGLKAVSSPKWGKRIKALGVEKVRNDGSKYPLLIMSNFG